MKPAAAPLVIDGYASLFGRADQMGDVVRRGAFRASLARRKGPVPMLVQHDARLMAGVWTEIREDARGLYVRGEIRADAPGAAQALRLLRRGVDGLSIGFVPIVAQKAAAGRLLEEIDLLEVSIVTLPMQPLARLTPRAGAHRAV
ncbi:MAG: HK97 family phage prohead protease [Hyphomonadaceae bacterium]